MRKGKHKRSVGTRTSRRNVSIQPEIDLDDLGNEIVTLTVLLLRRRNYRKEQIRRAVEAALDSTPAWVGELTGAAKAPGHLTGEVLTRWHLLPRYCRKGEPRALRMTGRLSFTSLVRSISRKADPAIILQQLVAAGAVRREGNEWVPTERELSLRNDPRAMAYHHTKIIRSALKTVEGNIRRREDLRQFEFSTFADVPSRIYREVAAAHRELGINFLLSLDQSFLQFSENSDPLEEKLGVGASLIFSDGRPLPPLTPPDDPSGDEDSTS